MNLLIELWLEIIDSDNRFPMDHFLFYFICFTQKSQKVKNLSFSLKVKHVLIKDKESHSKILSISSPQQTMIWYSYQQS